jgi:DNA-binding transcriptional ArsR family regulator
MVVPMFDTRLAIHSPRNTLTRSGDHGPRAGAAAVVDGEVIGAVCRDVSLRGTDGDSNVRQMSDNEPEIHHLDYAIDDRIDADTPARLKALGDPFRQLILDLVLERAMSVTELAERVGRPRGSVAHHVDLLVEVGLLQVVRTRKVRAIVERFYGRTARTIHLPDEAHSDDLPFFADARSMIDRETSPDTPGIFTMRAVRIPEARAGEFAERLEALALEFSNTPRGGTREFALLLALFATNRPVSPADTEKKGARRGS